jgi:hypothetical protein
MWARTLHDFSLMIHFMNKYFRRRSSVFQTAPRKLECRVELNRFAVAFVTAQSSTSIKSFQNIHPICFHSISTFPLK